MKINNFTYLKKIKSLYIRALSSLKDEGLGVLAVRSFNFIIYGKGVLNKEQIIQEINFSDWVKRVSEGDIEKFNEEINKFKYKPTISIITPVYNVDSKWLDMCIESVIGQVYKNWEFCLHDDASTKKETLECLKKWENKDPRIKISYGKKNKNISGASNEALKLATGEFVALLDNDDELKEDALFWIVKEINKHPDADLIYTDECKKTLDGQYVDFILKPDWSPEYLLNVMYTGHLSVYRKNIVEKAGLFRSEYDFSQDYDLALRVSEITEKIYHVERVLYFWRQIPGSAASGDKNFARKSNLAALADAMKRRNIKAEILEYPWANRARILFEHVDRISIIIPSDSYKNLKKTIDSIIDNTIYKNYEIIIVTNSSLIEKLKLIYSDSVNNVVFSKYDKKYNFSDKCNQGSEAASGEIVVFLNDDVFPAEKDWLDNLIEFLYYDQKIGAVSPKLLYEDDSIQYAGMTTNTSPFCGTFLNGKSEDELLAKTVRNTSILSGACLAIRKKVFFEIGGFDAINTPAGHSDLDLSFKLREAGYRCVYTPYSKLYHIGNHSWHIKKDKADIFVLSKWGKYISNDPYYTKSMCALLAGCPPEHFNIFSKQAEYKPYSFDALIVVCELTITGAPIVALNTARAILKAGGYPVLYSYVDGPLRSEFEKNNIPVIISKIGENDEFSFKHFAKNFDILIVNTVVAYKAVHIMQNIVPTIWYLHEAHNVETLFIPHFDKRVPTLRDVIKNTEASIYVASEYSKDELLKYFNEIKILNYGFDDQYNGGRIKMNEKIQFSMVGTVEKRKAQDVFVDAILQLPENYHQKAVFNIIGNEKYSKRFSTELKKKTENFANVYWHGLIVDQERKMDLFAKTSVFVVVSRDEPTSIVVIEGTMLGRPSIISKNVGAKYLIDDGKTGFIVDTGSVKNLKQTLMKIIDNPDMLIAMGKEARKRYLETSTLDIFQKNLIKAIDEKINYKNKSSL